MTPITRSRHKSRPQLVQCARNAEHALHELRTNETCQQLPSELRVKAQALLDTIVRQGSGRLMELSQPAINQRLIKVQGQLAQLLQIRSLSFAPVRDYLLDIARVLKE